MSNPSRTKMIWRRNLKYYQHTNNVGILKSQKEIQNGGDRTNQNNLGLKTQDDLADASLNWSGFMGLRMVEIGNQTQLSWE